MSRFDAEILAVRMKQDAMKRQKPTDFRAQPGGGPVSPMPHMSQPSSAQRKPHGNRVGLVNIGEEYRRQMELLNTAEGFGR